MLNSLNLNTITSLTGFCVNFNDAMNQNATLNQLHTLARSTASTIRDENNHGVSANSTDQYGEIMAFLEPIILAKDIQEARVKMLSLSMALMASAERQGENVYSRIGDELMRL